MIAIAMKQEHGFVLPITVVMLALVSVGIALMSQRNDGLRSVVLAAKEEQRALEAVEQARAEALYLSSVLHRRADRLGSIQLDGRYYRDSNGVFVRYQDGGSLFNLRRAPRQELVRLLWALGFNDDAQIDTIADRLLDYTDTDDLQRLNGAEQAEYRRAKMPAPRNERLATPTELQRLLGWRELPERQRRAILEHVYVGPQRTVNRYTVTPPVLAAVSGLELGAAADLIAQRQPGTPLRIESVLALTGGSYLAEGRYITVPATTLLVTLCHPSVAWCQHMAVTSTGESLSGPWHVDYSYRLARNVPLPDAKSVDALPNQLPDKPPPPLFSPFSNNLP